MIEGPQGPAGPARPASAQAPAVRRMGVGAQEMLLGLWRKVLPGSRDADAFLWNLRLANRALWLVLAALGVYVVTDLIVSKPATGLKALSAPPASGGKAMVLSGSTPPAADTLRSLSDYLVASKQRNPFTGETGGIAPASMKTAKSKLAELAEGLVVVGIDRGANPVALLENTSQQRTYMVRVGDEINGMIVKKIGQDGVTMTYEGEELLLP
jgi:hypothetical protein